MTEDAVDEVELGGETAMGMEEELDDVEDEGESVKLSIEDVIGCVVELCDGRNMLDVGDNGGEEDEVDEVDSVGEGRITVNKERHVRLISFENSFSESSCLTSSRSRYSST